jgi:hypothetical protein
MFKNIRHIYIKQKPLIHLLESRYIDTMSTLIQDARQLFSLESHKEKILKKKQKHNKEFKKLLKETENIEGSIDTSLLEQRS